MNRLAGAVTDASRVVAEEITFPVEDDRAGAFLARPAQPGSYPGLLLLHEAFGLNDHIRDVAGRLANVGYVVLAPDLYYRIGSPDPSNIESVVSKMIGLSDAEIVISLEAAARFLRGQGNVGRRVGCVGFCSGGRQSLLLAASSTCVDAAVDCWGGYIDRADAENLTTPERPVPIVDLLGGVQCSIFLAGGLQDTVPAPEVLRDAHRRLDEASPPAELHLYDAGHAFFADYRSGYNEVASHQLWADVTGFLDRHLRD